jgi:hypothetical protein
MRSRMIPPALTLLLAVLLCAPAWAGPREQARRMHDRLVGVPPDPQTLASMEDLLIQGRALEAAYEAMNHPAFYSTSLKNWITPWTNVDRTVFAPLNDYTATVIGIIRDDHPFKEVLSGDIVYVGQSPTPTPLPDYSISNNDHYEAIEARGIDLSDPAQFHEMPQSQLHPQLSSNDTAGIITTRAAAEAFFSAGTNRRMWRFLAINYLCRDMEALKDVERPADRIRQDVTRSPGGDSMLFHQQCVGCHSGMDPLAGAFAYLDWDENALQLIFTPGVVRPKFLRNSAAFPGGYITVDDRWDNFWYGGQNAVLGWRGPGSGFGPKTLGQEVANSRAFSECQVEKAFEHVCFRPPLSVEDQETVRDIATIFETNDHSMKRVFAEVAVYCKGD